MTEMHNVDAKVKEAEKLIKYNPVESEDLDIFRTLDTIKDLSSYFRHRFVVSIYKKKDTQRPKFKVLPPTARSRYEATINLESAPHLTDTQKNQILSYMEDLDTNGSIVGDIAAGAECYFPAVKLTSSKLTWYVHGSLFRLDWL